MSARNRAVLFGLALVYAWIVAGLLPFTLGEEVAVAIPIVVVVALGWRRPAPVEKPPGAWVWVLLFGVLTAWELVTLVALATRRAPDGQLPHRSPDVDAPRAARWSWCSGSPQEPGSSARRATGDRGRRLRGDPCRRRSRTPSTRRTGRQSLPDAIRRLMLHPVGRVVVLAAWAWVGWHLFARGSGAFE